MKCATCGKPVPPPELKKADPLDDYIASVNPESERAYCSDECYSDGMLRRRAGVFAINDYVSFPSGLGGAFSAKVIADNGDGTLSLKVLNDDWKDYPSTKIHACLIEPMDAPGKAYYRKREREEREKALERERIRKMTSFRWRGGM